MRSTQVSLVLNLCLALVGCMHGAGASSAIKDNNQDHVIVMVPRADSPTANERVQIPPSAGVPGAIPLILCRTIDVSGHYYLKNDVICTHQGFAINADNVRLDLRGHTITYGIKNKVVPAFSICDRWYKLLSDVPCGDAVHNYPEIYNGRIVQAAGSHPFTHAIWIGQANGVVGVRLHDLVITIQEKGTQAIHGEYVKSGWRVENNTINDNVTNIQQDDQGALSARSHLQGYAIWFDNGSNAPGKGDIISGNTINGTPQGGIFDSNQNSQIFKNKIHLSSHYSNDYGIIVTADGQKVYENLIDGRGRGIDAESSHFLISNNIIRTHEEPNNSEYNGCELNGTYGIRVKNYQGAMPPSTDWTVERNDVRVEAVECDARAMQFTDLTSKVAGTVRSNTLQVVEEKHSGYSLGFTGVDRPHITFVGNRLSATTCVLIGNDGSTDGANVFIQSGQEWNCGRYTVHDSDLAKTGGATYLQAVTILDTLPVPRVACGDYSTGTIRIGEFVHQCGK